MKTAEIQKWAADHGGWGEIVPTRVTKKVKTPLHPEGEDTAVTVYVLRTLNGSELKLQPQEGSNGDDPDNVEYDVIEDPKITTSPTARAGETASNSPYDRAKDEEALRESQWNRDTPIEQGGSGRFETHAARATREATEKKDAEAKGKKTYGPAYQNESKVWVRPWTDGAGNRGVEPVPEGERPFQKPEDKYSQTTQDKETGKWWGLKKDGSGWEEIQGGPGSNPTRLPAGIGEFQPDDTMPGYGLYERRAALLDLVAKGTITEAQMKEILTQDRELTNTWATQRTQIDNGANTAYDNLMTQRSQDITQSANRMTAANTQYSNALSYTNQNAVGLARSPGIKDSIGPLLRGQMLHAQRMGGMENAPAVPLPKVLDRYMTIELPGAAKVKIPVGAGGATGDTAAAPTGEAPAAAPTEQPAPEQTPAAMQNTDPNQAAYDLFGDDPEFQSQVGRVLGMGVA